MVRLFLAVWATFTAVLLFLQVPMVLAGRAMSAVDQVVLLVGTGVLLLAFALNNLADWGRERLKREVREIPDV